jgi:hypothetical protein
VKRRVEVVSTGGGPARLIPLLLFMFAVVIALSLSTVVVVTESGGECEKMGHGWW